MNGTPVGIYRMTVYAPASLQDFNGVPAGSKTTYPAHKALDGGYDDAYAFMLKDNWGRLVPNMPLREVVSQPTNDPAYQNAEWPGGQNTLGQTSANGEFRDNYGGTFANPAPIKDKADVHYADIVQTQIQYYIFGSHAEDKGIVLRRQRIIWHRGFAEHTDETAQ